MIDENKKSLTWFTERIGQKISSRLPNDQIAALHTISSFEEAEQLNMLQDETNVVFSDSLKEENPFERVLSKQEIVDIGIKNLVENATHFGIEVTPTKSFPFFNVKYEEQDWFFIAVFNVDYFYVKPQVDLNPSNFIKYKKAVQLLHDLSICEMLINNLNTLLDIITNKIEVVYE